MEVWRLTRAAHRDRALDGAGAQQFGNRWNSKGTAMAYTSSSLELAVLESMMHLSLHQIPTDYVWLCHEIPADSIEILDPLPALWDEPMPYEPSVQAIGDQWIQSGRSLALRVPATVLPMRNNILINPAHRRFAQVRLTDSGDFTWPTRLLARLGAPVLR